MQDVTRYTRWLILALVAIALLGLACNLVAPATTGTAAAPPSPATPPAAATLTPACGSANGSSSLSITFLNKVDAGAGARPEIVAANDLVFVIYLDMSVPGDTRYSVRIYDDKDLGSEMAYWVLVSESEGNGKPTDIRVASDGEYLYAFYELVGPDRTYLYGAKYRLDAGFEEVASTSGPIAEGPIFTDARPGDELVNDPIALVGPDSVFAITRIRQASFSQDEPMIYRVREFTYDLQTKLSEFDLDLSDVAGGEGRQASAIYYDGYYHMVVPTTTESGHYLLAMRTPSDLLMVTLDAQWEIVDSQSISQERDPDDVETFATGFRVHNDYFFVTYKQGWEVSGEWTYVSPLKVFDRNLGLVFSETVKEATGQGESLRSSLEVTSDRIYVGHSGGQGPPPPFKRDAWRIQGGSQTAEIYVYEIVEGGESEQVYLPLILNATSFAMIWSEP